MSSSMIISVAAVHQRRTICNILTVRSGFGELLRMPYPISHFRKQELNLENKFADLIEREDF